MILQSAEPLPASTAAGNTRRVPLLLSAKDAEGLRATAEGLPSTWPPTHRAIITMWPTRPCSAAMPTPIVCC